MNNNILLKAIKISQQLDKRLKLIQGKYEFALKKIIDSTCGCVGHGHKRLCPREIARRALKP